jgi:hypothetical protein
MLLRFTKYTAVQPFYFRYCISFLIFREEKTALQSSFGAAIIMSASGPIRPTALSECCTLLPRLSILWHDKNVLLAGRNAKLQPADYVHCFFFRLWQYIRQSDKMDALKISSTWCWSMEITAFASLVYICVYIYVQHTRGNSSHGNVQPASQSASQPASQPAKFIY